MGGLGSLTLAGVTWVRGFAQDWWERRIYCVEATRGGGIELCIECSMQVFSVCNNKVS